MGFSLEVETKIVDIEHGRFADNRNSSVYGYSFLVNKIHQNIDSGMSRDQAIKAAVETCIEENILAEYINSTGLQEVMRMLNYEYNHADEIAYRAYESREEGREEGKAEALTEVIHKMKERGMSIEDIAQITSLSVKEAAQYYEI